MRPSSPQVGLRTPRMPTCCLLAWASLASSVAAASSAEPNAVPLAAPARTARAGLAAVLLAEPGEVRALEAAAAEPFSAEVHAADPALKLYQRLARARAHLLGGRLDEVEVHLEEVLSGAPRLPPADRRPLVAEVRYRLAELSERRAPPSPSCGPLGLERVALVEGARARTRLETLTARYRAVLETGDRFWARRAAFRIAVLSEEFLRMSLALPPGLRAAPLPVPFSVPSESTATILEPAFAAPWRAEVAAVYRDVMASIDERAPDPPLLELARARARMLADLPAWEDERIHNPWRAAETPGLVRFGRRHERRTAAGTWVMMAPAEGAAALSAQLQQPLGTVEHAYALVGLAVEGRAPPSASHILAALAHDAPQVRLAGLVAAEHAPAPELLDALVEVYAASVAEGASRGLPEPFATLQGALFGPRERALRALRALATKDRAAAAAVLEEPRLPARDRAWIVAELGDERLGAALQGLLRDTDPTTTATAIYALALAPGGRGAPWLRPRDAGVVGCVSRTLAQVSAP